jgi:hypothetical protein
LPASVTTSLSMPRGPSVVRMASTTAWHALMFEMSCPLPCTPQPRAPVSVCVERRHRAAAPSLPATHHAMSPHLRRVRAVAQQNNLRPHASKVGVHHLAAT